GAGHDVVLTTIIGGPATRLTISPKVSGAAAGSPVIFTVTALDANNLVANNYTGTVTFSSSTDSVAVLPPGAPLAGGSGTFSATFKTAGSETLSATDVN